MADSERRFIIVADELSVERREVIQEMIKEMTDKWWHEFPNVWIVIGGDSAGYWRNPLNPVMRGTGRSLIVVELKNDGSWAGHGPQMNERMGKWFRANF